MKINETNLFAFLLHHAEEYKLSGNEMALCRKEKGCQVGMGCCTMSPAQYLMNNFLHVIKEKHPDELKSICA